MMSVLGNLFNRILHRKDAATPTASGAATTTAQASPTGSGAAPQPNTQTMERVDVEQVLEDMAAKNPQKLNWRTSIVDLMKLVGMESSLHERQQLADELGYTGDKNDSAAMNIWLHKQVMKKLEENGGKLPADLQH